MNKRRHTKLGHKKKPCSGDDSIADQANKWGNIYSKNAEELDRGKLIIYVRTVQRNIKLLHEINKN